MEGLPDLKALPHFSIYIENLKADFSFC